MDVVFWQLTPEQEAYREQIRRRAAEYLEAHRDRLPKLTKKHEGVIVDMLTAAYAAGEGDRAQEQFHEQREAASSRSARAVAARRQNAIRKREKLLRAFKAASGTAVSVEQLAKEHGVSRATAYRALRSSAPGKRRR